ncbi:MAG: hypothetical protein IT426_13240 [Pirellulales bacterium]|nr:hypothetical protein [Pirellulales bacterium]
MNAIERNFMVANLGKMPLELVVHTLGFFIFTGRPTKPQRSARNPKRAAKNIEGKRKTEGESRRVPAHANAVALSVADLFPGQALRMSISNNGKTNARVCLNSQA